MEIDFSFRIDVFCLSTFSFCCRSLLGLATVRDISARIIDFSILSLLLAYVIFVEMVERDDR